MTRILLSTTSFQDTPGKHHDVLTNSGFEIVRERGPLSEAKMIELVTTNGGFDGLLNGDDQITAKVIDAAMPRLKVIAKYGIGAGTGYVFEYTGDAIRSLSMEETRLNVEIYRIRQDFAAIGVHDATGVVERRRGSRQVRLGTSRLAIAPMD